jgi:hypothetical protein
MTPEFGLDIGQLLRNAGVEPKDKNISVITKPKKAFNDVCFLVTKAFPDDALSEDWGYLMPCTPEDPDDITRSCRKFQNAGFSPEEIAAMVLKSNSRVLSALTLGLLTDDAYLLMQAQLAEVISGHFTRKSQIEREYGTAPDGKAA